MKDGKQVNTEMMCKGNLQKEISNVSGIIDWKKGIPLLIKRQTLWRPIEFAEELSLTKLVKLLRKDASDVLACRGRLFGMADFNLKKSVFELGLGAQGAFEVNWRSY